MWTPYGYTATPLLSILCWALCQNIGHVTTAEVYNLSTPQPDGGTALTSCVYVLEMSDVLDPVSGLIDPVSLPVGTLLPASHTTHCTSTHTGHYDLNIKDTETPLVQLSDSNNADLFDAFLPLPANCLGTKYVVATWNPGAGTAYVGLYNPSLAAITVDISLGPASDPPSVLVDGVGATQRHGNSLQISAASVKYVTSSSESLDGLTMTSSDSVGVWAGNTGTAVFGFGMPSNFLEMFPPKEMFSDEYVVPLPPYAVNCALKVISLSEDSQVEVTLTQLLEGSPSTSTTTNTLTELGDTWTHTHTNSLLLQATGPVMAVQFNPEASLLDASAMTLVPPTSMWAWSAVIYPLTSSLSGLDDHVVIINIKTIYVSGLVAYNLFDGSDVTSSLSFMPFNQSEYSYGTLTVDASYIILLQHSGFQTFQVVQYGSSEDVNGLYALPVTWDTTSCPQTQTTTTTTTTTATSQESLVDSSNSSTSQIPSATDNNSNSNNIWSQDFMIYAFVSGTMFVAAMSIIIGTICVHVKNKHKPGRNGNITLQKVNSKPGEKSVRHGDNQRVIDTSKRKGRLDLPHIVRVKPVQTTDFRK